MHRNAIFSVPFLLSLLVAVMLNACGTAEPPSTQNTMTALVDKTTWRAVDVSAQHKDSTITIQGTSAIDISIRFVLRGDSTGTYELGKVINQGMYVDGPTTWVAFGVGTGTVTITAIDSLHVAGFFGFQAKDTTSIEQPRLITNGSFDIDFVQ